MALRSHEQDGEGLSLRICGYGGQGSAPPPATGFALSATNDGEEPLAILPWLLSSSSGAGRIARTSI